MSKWQIERAVGDAFSAVPIAAGIYRNIKENLEEINSYFYVEALQFMRYIPTKPINILNQGFLRWSTSNT